MMNGEELCTSMALRCATQPPRKRRLLYPNSWIQGLALLGILAVMVSIPWESMRLYQAALAHRASQVAQGAPPECSQETWTLLSSIRAYLATMLSWSTASSVCQDYYYLLLVDPLWEVTPLVVLSSLGTRCFLHPLELISSSLGRSPRLFFSEIPLHWQPVFLCVVVVSGLILSLVLSGYRLSIPLLLKLEPKKNSQSSKESKSGDLLDCWTRRSFDSYGDGRDSTHTLHTSAQRQLTNSPFSYHKINDKHVDSLLSVSPVEDIFRFQASTTNHQLFNNGSFSANYNPHMKYSLSGQIPTKESCKIKTLNNSFVSKSTLSVYQSKNSNKNLLGETATRQPFKTLTKDRYHEVNKTPDNSYNYKQTTDKSYSQIKSQNRNSAKLKTNKKTSLRKKTNTDTLWKPKNEDYSFSDSE